MFDEPHQRGGRGRASRDVAARLSAILRQSVPRDPSPAAEATTDGRDLGERVIRARQRAGLTRKQLAERLDVSVWKIERLESEGEDLSRYAPAIAAATATPADWFEERAAASAPPETAGDGRSNGAAPSDLADGEPPASGEATTSTLGANVVLVSLVLLVVVRFFTEVVPIVPRFVNFVDIPILATIAAIAIMRPSGAERSGRFTAILLLVFGFLVVCTVAILANPTRVDLAPALVFLYGFLGPIGLFFAVYRLWPVGLALRLSRLLVALCVLQIVIAFGIDLPLFLANRNPDVISGTFGENPYQLVYFLLVVVGLLAGIFTFEKYRLAARLTPLLLFGILAVIFLAQYRSLLLTTALTVVFLGILLSSLAARGLVVTVLASAALLGTLAYVAQNIPALKFGETLEEARADPTFYLQARLDTFSVVERVFNDTPRFAITGTGPGTYSSRAWRTFAVTSDSQSDVAGEYVLALTQGRPYRTDVSDKYVQPQLRTLEFLGGSSAATRPFASYLSLVAEVGLLGLVLLVAMYVWAFVRSARMTLLTGRKALPGDPLPALFCASTVAFFVLLQMGALDNWLEVTRITFIAWIVLAVATKEFDGRAQPDG